MLVLLARKQGISGLLNTYPKTCLCLPTGARTRISLVRGSLEVTNDIETAHRLLYLRRWQEFALLVDGGEHYCWKLETFLSSKSGLLLFSLSIAAQLLTGKSPEMPLGSSYRAKNGYPFSAYVFAVIGVLGGSIPVKFLKTA